MASAKPQFDTKTQIDAQVSAKTAAILAATTDTVTASTDASFDYSVPDITVTKNAPKPRVAVGPVGPASATAVSATVVAAIAAPAVPAPGQAVDGNAIVAEGMKLVGTPYLAGGKGPGGFDCSGFIQYVFGLFGISTPSSSSGYANIGTRVSAADALPGDILYTPGHVGIYAGGGQQLDSPVPGKTLQLRGIWQSNPVYIRIG